MKTQFSTRTFIVAIVLVVVAAAIATHCTAQPAYAASTSDPAGYRRCRIGEIAADPQHKVCKRMTWVEWHSGGTVRFTAFVRKVGK